MRNPFTRKAEQENAKASAAFPANIPKIGFLLQILLILTMLGAAFSWYFIDTAAQEERRHMIAAMQGRAEALAGAVEGSARFLGYGSGGMLAEMARQPGIAWIAIVDSEGYITQDSNFGLDGKRLYTEKELAQLAPGPKIQGRFSPDDPAIYETWKSFSPQRLRGRHCKEDRIIRGLSIFIGQDAQGFTRRLDEYVNRLRLLSTMIILAVLCTVSLLFLLQRYRSSRRQLADTQALAEQVIRNYPAAMIVTDANGQVRLCNEPGRMLLDDARGKSPNIADLPAIDWQNLKTVLDSGEVILEKNYEIFRNDAPPLPVSISAARIFDSSGTLAGYLIVARDLGEIRKLEKKLRQSERLSSLGHLAAGLAHEIRNPLSSIKGYATYLAEKLKADPLAKGAAELLAEETGRLNRVLSDLLSLAKPPATELKALDLGATLKRAVDLASPEAKAKNIDLELVLPEEITVIRGDADRLVQAFLNLLMNAVQATQTGGKIRAVMRTQPKNIQIDISDNGPGMSEETSSQIFTPYFTTRSQGTGLGLAIVQQIAEAHGGSVSVASRLWHGSVFTMELPRGETHG